MAIKTLAHSFGLNARGTGSLSITGKALWVQSTLYTIMAADHAFFGKIIKEAGFYICKWISKTSLGRQSKNKVVTIIFAALVIFAKFGRPSKRFQTGDLFHSIACKK